MPPNHSLYWTYLGGWVGAQWAPWWWHCQTWPLGYKGHTRREPSLQSQYASGHHLYWDTIHTSDGNIKVKIVNALISKFSSFLITNKHRWNELKCPRLAVYS